MDSKKSQTLKTIFTLQTRPDIKWTDIESLFIALGAKVDQGKGSRIRVSLNGVKAVFHKPHPEREISKSAVKMVREFLKNAGVQPND